MKSYPSFVDYSERFFDDLDAPSVLDSALAANASAKSNAIYSLNLNAANSNASARSISRLSANASANSNAIYSLLCNSHASMSVRASHGKEKRFLFLVSLLSVHALSALF